MRLEKARTSLAKRRELLRATVSDKALKLQAKKAQLQENNLQVGIGRSHSFEDQGRNLVVI